MSDKGDAPQAETRQEKAEPAVVKAAQEAHVPAQDNPAANKQEQLKADTQAMTTGDKPLVPALQLNGLTDKQVGSAVKELRQASGLDTRDSEYPAAPDSARLTNTLANASEKDRKAIGEAYKKETGKDLADLAKDMTGSDKAKFLAALNRQDGNIPTQSSDRVNVTLGEASEWRITSGRSQKEIEKDLRDTYRQLNGDQLKELNAHHKQTYGITADERIAADRNISKETKEAIGIYSKGAEKIDDKEAKTLLDSAIKAKDINLLSEAARQASPEVRQSYLKDFGDFKLFQNFANPGDSLRAVDLLKNGRDTEGAGIKAQTDKFAGLTTNDEAITGIVKGLNPEQKSDYLIGRHLQNPSLALSAENKERLEKLSPEERQKASYVYQEIKEPLAKAGSSAQFTKWENDIAHPDNKFLQGFDKHRGYIYNAGAGEVRKDVENISPADLAYARQHPEQRQELQKTLSSILRNPADVKSIVESYDKIVGNKDAKSHEESLRAGQRPVLEALDANKGILGIGSDPKGGLEALSKITPAEQDKYRNDPEFARKLDKSIDSLFMHNPAGKAGAERIMGQIKRGESPSKDDFLTKLAGDGAERGALNGDNTIRQIRDEFKKNPSLFEAIKNPKTDSEKEQAKDYEKITKAALGLQHKPEVAPSNDEESHYDRQNGALQELNEKGTLGLERTEKLTRKNSNVDDTHKDIAALSKEDRETLLKDERALGRLMPFAGADQREIARRVATNGEFGEVDKLRSAIASNGGDKDTARLVKEISERKSGKTLDDVSKEYTEAYKRHFESDVLSGLSGRELLDGQRALASSLTPQERLERERTTASETRSGVGSSFTDNYSRTGQRLDSVRDQAVQESAEANKKHTALTPEQVKRSEEQYKLAIENNIKSKESTASVTAGALTGTAVLLSGGALAPSLISGGVINPAIKKTILGDHYNSKLQHVATDIGVGSINGGAGGWGPRHLASALNIGSSASKTAIAETVAGQGGRAAFAEGSEKTLETGLKQAYQKAILTGSKGVDEKAVGKLVEQSLAADLSGEARTAAHSQLTKALTEGVNKQLPGGALRRVEEEALHAAGASTGSSGAGAAEGVRQNYDGREDLATNATKAIIKAGEKAASVHWGKTAGRVERELGVKAIKW